MLALGSVASLAWNVGMTAQFLLVYNVGVAGFADVMPGKSRRAGCDLGDGCAAVVAVLAKALGTTAARSNTNNARRMAMTTAGRMRCSMSLSTVAFPAPGAPKREKAQ